MMNFKALIAAMSHLVFSLSVAILLNKKEKRQNTQLQSSMKAVITKETLH